jgi:hypothetical protein
VAFSHSRICATLMTGNDMSRDYTILALEKAESARRKTPMDRKFITAQTCSIIVD